MTTESSKVMVNGKVVGFMSDLDVDMPWFRARFEPTPLFREFEPLFASLDQAYEEKHYDRVNQLNEEINKLKVSITDDIGQLLYSSDPSDRPLQRISTVRIRPNQIVWRPVPQ